MTALSEAQSTNPAADRGMQGLEALEISKYFSGVPALSCVSIAVRPGKVVGLAGHNGAGKSTLLKILSGVYRPDEGTVVLNGAAVDLHSPRNALARGIATVHQELSLLSNLTAMQNTFLAQERTQLGFLKRSSMLAETQQMVQRFDLDIDVDRPIGVYSVATRQLLELAIATHRNARFLLLDEPTTSLEGEQIDKLLATVRSLAHEGGVGIMLIDHKLDELYAVADSIVALVDGQVRINGPAGSVAREEVVRAIAGDEAAVHIRSAAPVTGADSAVAATTATAGEPSLSGEAALEVHHLQTKVLESVSLTARAGRVLGIYGLVGAGRTEFLRTLVGLDDVHSGAIALFGRPYRPQNPAAAQKVGIVYLTEERKRDGIIAPLDAVVNTSLPVLHRFRRYGFLRLGDMQRGATAYLDLLKVRGDRSQPVLRLSGGNQQKVLLARALAQDPKILLLDEPTKGVDIGVKVDIHRMIRELAHDKGLTVLLVSSEEEEILELADDVVVFVGGKCSGDVALASQLTATQLRKEAWVPA
jgi:ABC-type sugar transport system ATPase subunit